MESDHVKRPVLIGGIVLIILIIIGLGILIYWINSQNYISTDDASIEGTHVSVSAKTMGRIKKLLVDEGDKVTAGQILIELDDADLNAQENQSHASLNLAKQNLDLAKINLDKAEEDYKRIQSVYKSGAVTKEQYDHALKALEAAKAQYEISQSQINISEAQLGIIKTQSQNLNITAPISGVIAKKNAMTGEVIQPGQVIFTINDLSDIWIIANIEETKIAKIQIGEKVIIKVDAYPNKKFEGTVAQISAAIIPPPFSIGESTKTTQKIPIKLKFNQFPESYILLPGMSVEVKIKVK